MAGLFTEFLVEKCATHQSRKSDFGWHRFCFSPCWMRKSIIKAQVILALLDSFQELHLEIWKAWVIIIFISNFMKSRAVYEASLCTFVLRFETLIWPSMRFDISVQKSLVDFNLPQIERKNFPKNILAVERKLWAIFLSRVHLWKQQTPGSRRLKT